MKKMMLYPLPHELIIEILVRLPVKSLLRFKCVCKSWFSLISDPHFANSHFQLTHIRRIMFISVFPPRFGSIDFEAFLANDSDPASLNIKFWILQSDFLVKIKGSCRGFIILYCCPDIFIWNPSTGFKKHITLSPFNINKAYISLCGFGYDQSRDDYVAVVLSHDNVVSSHLEFFSFRDNNTWKEIEGNHIPYIGDLREGLFFNGAIHWLAFRPDLKMDVIVVFDLTERKLFEMSLPNDFDQEIPMGCGLWVFGEFLSLWAMDYDNDIAEIWVMKEYKVNSSWTKTLVLPLDVIPNLYFNPICSTKKGDIIGTSRGTRLVKYNDKGQLLGHRSFRNCPSDIVMFTESLFSLPGDNEQVSEDDTD